MIFVIKGSVLVSNASSKSYSLSSTIPSCFFLLSDISLLRGSDFLLFGFPHTLSAVVFMDERFLDDVSCVKGLGNLWDEIEGLMEKPWATSIPRTKRHAKNNRPRSIFISYGSLRKEDVEEICEIRSTWTQHHAQSKLCKSFFRLSSFVLFFSHRLSVVEVGHGRIWSISIPLSWIVIGYEYYYSKLAFYLKTIYWLRRLTKPVISIYFNWILSSIRIVHQMFF